MFTLHKILCSQLQKSAAAPLQPVERCSRAQEDFSARRFRSAVFQIRSDCLSDVMGQRQRPFLTAFAMHAQASFGPVDISEFKTDDFPCAQSQGGGVRAPSTRRGCCMVITAARSRGRPSRPCWAGSASRRPSAVLVSVTTTPRACPAHPVDYSLCMHWYSMVVRYMSQPKAEGCEQLVRPVSNGSAVS